MTDFHNLGSTVDKLKKLRSISFKELTNNGEIISKSAYYRFAKNETDIHSDQFMVLLDRLNITMKEFEFIRNGYQLPKIETLTQEMAVAVGQANITALNKLGIQSKQLYQETNLIQYHHLAITINLYINRIQSTVVQKSLVLSTESQSGIKEITHYLLNLDLWSAYDIVLCNNVFFDISANNRNILIHSASKSFHQYRQFTSETSQFFTFLVNQLFLDIELGQFKHIPTIFKRMTEIKLLPGWTTEPLLLRFCQGFNDYVTEADQSLDHCREAIHIANELQVNQWIQTFGLVFTKFQDTVHTSAE